MLRFFIIDDHAIIRKGLKQILQSEYPSASFEEAVNAEDATQKIITGEFDVVICDLSMPGRHGLDVVKHIKLLHPKLPVLILSLHPEEQYAIRALKAGADGYLNKDVALDELVKAVQKVLLGRKYISPFVGEKLAGELENSNHNMPHVLLSNRELHVFRLIAQGKAVSEIAGSLSLSTTTVSTYRSRIMIKMNMKVNAELTRYALEHQII